MLPLSLRARVGMYNRREQYDRDMLKILFPDRTWNSIHTYTRADKIPDSQLFRLIDNHSQAFELCLMPLAKKSILERAVRVWQRMQHLICQRQERHTKSQVKVEASPCGRFSFLLTPVKHVRLAKNHLYTMNIESLFLLATDLGNLLHWLHTRPLDLRLPAFPDDDQDQVETLWMLADSGNRVRHDVNRLNRLVEQCQKKSTRQPKTPVFNAHAPSYLRLDELNRLRCSYPPFIRAGDPWLDVARHLLIFEGKLLPFRELVINIYFDLTPNTAFFQTLFLYELNAHGKMWQKDIMGNPKTGTPSFHDFASRYQSSSPIPTWYEAFHT